MTPSEVFAGSFSVHEIPGDITTQAATDLAISDRSVRGVRIASLSVRMSPLNASTKPVRDFPTANPSPGRRHQTPKCESADMGPSPFGYQIDSPSDLPQGFYYRAQDSTWRKAFFLPGERQSGSRETPESARICILTQDCLTIYSYPASCEPPFVAPLDQLVELTSHKTALCGTVGFSTLASTESFRYSAVDQKFVNTLLSAIRSASLPLHPLEAPAAIDPRQVDPPLELRCRYVLELELDPEESILALCALDHGQRRGFFWLRRAGPLLVDSCLVFTNQRIMTIASEKILANRHRGIRMRYAPISAVRNAQIERKKYGFCLSMSLRNDHTWAVGLDETQAASLSRILYPLAAYVDLRCR